MHFHLRLKDHSIIALIALCALLYLPYLGRAPFFDKGEPREALAVQDIVERGEWLVPLKRATDIPSKPPLFHWSAALASRVTGRLNEATVRFPSALYATLGVVVLFLLARKLFGAEVGLISGAILATTLVYQSQAVNARVDMTLCFFVTLNLTLFYLLYRGFLTRPIYYYLFYAVVGIGVLAKGPLGILLTVLVAGAFVLIRRRWDMLAKFCLHPGILLMLVLGAGWYVIAVMRGGEGFFHRQILEESIGGFTGGAGHHHPFYYYVPYLFSQALPWTLFLPFVLWDSARRFSFSQGDKLFFYVWVIAMFAFFSVAMEKRPVYLLPLYPALSVLVGEWLYEQSAPSRARLVLYRAVATVAGAVGFILLVVTVGGWWKHDPGWFFASIARLLSKKDRVNFLVVRNALSTFGWSFAAVSLASAVVWLALGWSFWFGKVKAAAYQAVLLSILMAFAARGIVIPEIARTNSYREFMARVNQAVKPGDALYLYGDSFNSDPLVFYHGAPIPSSDEGFQALTRDAGSGKQFLIMTTQTWDDVRRERKLWAPLLQSEGKGPEGDARLVLVRAK